MNALRPWRNVARLPRIAAAARVHGTTQQFFLQDTASAKFLIYQSYSRILVNSRSLSTESLPRIVQPSFWKSLLPKFGKLKHDADLVESKPKKKDWNPATFFIAMIMLIGSQAIQMIALRQDFVHFSNQTEARLAKLREVVNRIQNGEHVDVAAALGTGDKAAEREWEEVIRELEEEDELYRRKRRDSNPEEPSIPSFGSNDSNPKG